MADEPNEIVATSKAVEETAKTTGKAIDASSKLGQWLGQIFGDLVEDSVGLASDRLKYYRHDNLIKTHEKFLKKWEVKGLKLLMPLPTGVAIKAIEEVSLAEDDSLQDLWANLLVNGMSPDFKAPIERSYVSILGELTTYDAIVFDNIAKQPKVSFRSKFQIQDINDFAFDPHSSETEVSICNIHRLGLLMSRHDHYTHDSMMKPLLTNYRGGENLILSALGGRFWEAIS